MKRVDMRTGSPAAGILLFALPLCVGNVFQQLYNLVDSLVVGRFVGTGALAAVGACSSAYSFLSFLVLGLTTGASVVSAQAYGSGVDARVRQSLSSSLIIIFLTGAALTLVGVFAARPLLRLLGTPADILPDAANYLFIMCLGLLATCLYNAMAAFLRAIGNSVVPLAALILSSLLNVGLDLLFVICFRWDVAGVAVATLISQLVSGMFCLIYLRMRRPQYTMGFNGLKLDPVLGREVLRVGLPSAFSTSVVTLSAMMIQRAVNAYGSGVVAAFTISSKAEMICAAMSFSFAMAVGIFCGQNVGAGDTARVRRGVRAGTVICLAYSTIVGLGMFLFADRLAGVFTDEAQVIDIAAEIVRIMSYFSPVLALVFMFQHVLRNLSDVRPTIWMSCSEIAARSGLAFLFSYLWGYHGIWWATPVGWTGALIIGASAFLSGRWKTKCRIAALPDETL